MKAAVIFYHKNILSIYKREWIDKCIASIKSQTLKEFDVFELNYGDTNDKFCEGVRKNYVFLKVPLKNHTYAMNFLISHVFSLGYDMVFNTNMDDYYDSTRFVKQAQKVKQGYDLISSNFYYMDRNKIIRSMKMTSCGDIGDNLFKDHNLIAHPVICMSKTFWHVNLRYNDMLGYEDLDLWKRAYKAGKKFFILVDFLLYYRLHANQVTKFYSITGEIKKEKNIHPNNISTQNDPTKGGTRYVPKRLLK